MAKTPENVEIGGYCPLSRHVVIALEYLAHVVAEEHVLHNGETALFWHLVGTIGKHVASIRKVEVAPELFHHAKQLADSCEGRIPADSSDAVSVEAIHVMRLREALASALPGREGK